MAEIAKDLTFPPRGDAELGVSFGSQFCPEHGVKLSPETRWFYRFPTYRYRANLLLFKNKVNSEIQACHKKTEMACGALVARSFQGIKTVPSSHEIRDSPK